jgi:hypothetical protein
VLYKKICADTQAYVGVGEVGHLTQVTSLGDSNYILINFKNYNKNQGSMDSV